jgi:hypothetical protein
MWGRRIPEQEAPLTLRFTLLLTHGDAASSLPPKGSIYPTPPLKCNLNINKFELHSLRAGFILGRQLFIFAFRAYRDVEEGSVSRDVAASLPSKISSQTHL